MRCQYVVSELDTRELQLSYGACKETATHKIAHPYIVIYVCEKHAAKWQGGDRKVKVEKL